MEANDRRTSAGYLFAACALFATVACCLFYAQRDRLLVRYHASIALTADQPLRASEQWLMEHESLAAPFLVSYLRQPDNSGCDRAATLLEKMLAERRDPTNPDQSHFTLALATRLHERFEAMSPAGRTQAVEISMSILESQLARWSPSVPTALETAGQLLLRALGDGDEAVREKALWGLMQCWNWNGADNVAGSMVEQWKRQCYAKAVDLLDADSPGLRLSAARAIRFAPFHEGDIRLIALLSDENPAVRKSALLALVHKADSLSFAQRTKLFSLLHSPDREVREATGQLLLNAGGSVQEIRLATMLHHPVLSERIRAARLAASAPGSDAVWWLSQLLKDESAAVRIAAVRNSVGITDANFHAKIAKLAEKDVDPAVRLVCKERLATKIASKK